MSARIEHALGRIEHFVDKFGVLHRLPILVFEQRPQMPALILQLPAVGSIKAGKRIPIVITSGNQVFSMRHRRAVEDLFVELCRNLL